MTDPRVSVADIAQEPILEGRATWYAQWLRGALDRRFVSALLLVGALTMGTRALAAGKDLVVAYLFGISDDLDAFIVASIMPTFVLYAFAASFADGFLPVYVRERERHGVAAARRFLTSASAIGFASLSLVAVVLAVAAPWSLGALAGGFGPEKGRTTTLLFLGLLPLLVVGGWSSPWAAALNAHSRHFVSAVVPLATPTLTIALLLIAFGSWGVGALVAGYVVGAVVEAFVLGAALRQLGLPVIPRWYGLDAATVRFARQSLPLIVATLIATGSVVVDQSMAASVGPGAVSAFSYSGKILMLITGLSGVMLTIVVLPRFAQLAASGETASLRRGVVVYLVLAMSVAIMIAAALAAFSHEAVAVLFERGSFGQDATVIVAPVQALLALQLPFVLGNMLAVRLLIAVSRTRWIVITSVLNLALHYVGNVLLVPAMGINGIALSSGIAALVTFAALLVASLYELSPGKFAHRRPLREPGD